MPGFQSYDAILAALSAGAGQEVPFSKTLPITTAAGVHYSSWLWPGMTQAGALSGVGGALTATLTTCNSNTVGAIPLVSPTSASATNPYLTTVGAMPNVSMQGTLMLIDRLADTGLLTTGIGQTCVITNPVGGWARYTNGVGVCAFLESQAAAPTATAVAAMSYTNPAAVAGRVPSPATLTGVAYKCFGSGANAPTGSPFFTLQGNDNGIKSIENLSFSVAAALNVALVVCKPLLMVPCVTAGYYTERDLVIQTPKLPQLGVAADATACLQWIFIPQAAVANLTVMGSVATVTG